MKRFLMLVGVAAVAAAMYVAASPASQQSKGPTEKQFLVLQKKVTALTKKVKTAQLEADFATSYIVSCLATISGSNIDVHLLGVSQVGSTANGFLFGAPGTPPASATARTALDVDNSSTATDVLQAFDPACLSGGLRHNLIRSGLGRLHLSMAKNTR